MKKKTSVVILGASFSTGNLGVSALAWSSIRVIKNQWPDAEISLLGAGTKVNSDNVRLPEETVAVKSFPVRYCINVLAPHHIVTLGLAVLLCRILPFAKKVVTSENTSTGALLGCDVICDITGGDSFSDIYGLKRFMRAYLLKRICQMTGKPFILLPQTYGPFNSSIARNMALKVLTRSNFIFSRDEVSMETVRKITGTSRNLHVCPDLAFILDPFPPPDLHEQKYKHLFENNGNIIGININGMLYNGGYTGDNMFGLRDDYRKLIISIVLFFLEHTSHHLLFTPHVIPPDSFRIENDSIAGEDILNQLSSSYQKRISSIGSGYDQNEVKYFIGMCNFFLGSRMHATIAALSQGIPAIGLAYSKKFSGVFKTAGVDNCVIDLRTTANNATLGRIQNLFHDQEAIRESLRGTIPSLKRNILSMMNELNL